MINLRVSALDISVMCLYHIQSVINVTRYLLEAIAVYCSVDVVLPAVVYTNSIKLDNIALH